MPQPPDELIYELDTLYATTGTIAQICLIDGTLATSTISAIDTGTEVVTTTTHNLTTGARIRISTTGILPTTVPSINAGTDYYANAITDTTLTFHNTLADAIAGTNEINFSDSGSGTHTITEQALTYTDRKEVIIAHELDHPDYTREALTDIGTSTAVLVGGIWEASKSPYTWTQSVSPGEATLEFKHYLVLRGGTSTIGNTTGDVNRLITKTTPVAIAANNATLLGITLTHSNET